ncbi:MAG: DUF6164 family protein [Gammaproteobacteria bacterium]|nr:DUF6164 family protein [Gammaproteobacteria bacterium]MDH3767205.1 DUF6164 family protein [Gammaproteobacteria bacterium]
MAVLLFRLRGVPDDEAEDIRNLLTAKSIDYYETPAGNWGVSMPSLWLNDERQLETAKALIEAYQTERAENARAEYARLKAEGKQRRLLDELKENPTRFAAYLLLAIVVLYFSTKPFLDMIG